MSRHSVADQPGTGEPIMSLHNWLQKVSAALTPGRGRSGHRPRGSVRAARHRPVLQLLEDRCVLTQYAVTDLGTLGCAHCIAADMTDPDTVVRPASQADA